MKKLKLFFACLLMAVLSIGQVWGAVYFEDTFSNVGTGSSGSILPRDGWSGSGTTAPQYNTGVRIGASSSGATLTKAAMSNIEGTKSLKVTIYVSRYNTNANTLTVTTTNGTIASATLAENVSTGSELKAGTLTIKPSANAGVTSTTAPATWTDAYKTEFTITGASSSTTIAFASDKRLVLGPVTIEDAPATTTPTIGANPGAAAFGTKNIYYEGNKSGSLDIAVSGSNLTGNITAALSGDDAGKFSISGAPFAPTDGEASGTLTVSYEVTAAGDYSASLTLSSDGAESVVLPITLTATNVAPTLYNRVQSAAELSAGAKIIIVNEEYKKAAGAISGTLLSIVDITDALDATNGELSITEEAVQVFTLGGEAGAWTLTSDAGQLSSVEAKKMLADGETTWAITITDGDAVPVSSTAAAGTLQYNDNSGSGRFTTYTSTQKPVQFYAKSDGKSSAGLAYDAADAQKLVKVGGSLDAPTLSNDNNLSVSYASSNTDVVEVNASTGAITAIKAAGKAVITASFAGNDDYKEGSASYTIFVAEKAGTNEEGEILTEAIAKELIDLGCTLDVYVTGTILTPQYYDQSKTYTVTLTDGFQFYYFYAGPNEEQFDADILTAGDVLVAYGNLKKSGNNYRLNPCYMVSREPYTAPKTSIANTKETAYTVAQALAYAADPVTYDITESVYIAGVVYDVKSFNSNNGTYDIYIKDAGAENKFEFRTCTGLYDADLDAVVPFDEGDVQIGDEVIGYGVMYYYNQGSIWQFNQGGNYLVSLNRPEVAVTGIEMTESTAEVEVGSTVTLHASVDPGNATDQGIVWSVTSGSDKASVDENGVVTGTAAGEAVVRAASHEDASIYEECTVTVTAVDPTVHHVTFIAGTDKSDETSITKDGITISATTFNNDSYYQCYASSAMTVSSTVGNITNIELTCTASGIAKYGPGNWDFTGYSYDGTNGSWAGSAETVEFGTASQQVRMTLITVTYKEDSRAEAGLAWNPADDIEITVGDAFTAPTLLNPNSIDAAEITIESSNTSLATVTAGVVALVADATGEATITATFAGNDDYKPATVSYNITVNAAAPVVLTDYYEKVTSGAVAEGTYLIVYEAGNIAFNGGLETLDASSNTIEVEITNDNKIGVTQATAAATFYIDPTAGTIQAANGKYIGVTSNSNGLKTSDNADAYSHNFSIDGDGNAVIAPNFEGSTMTLRYNTGSGQTRFRYYGSGQQAIQLYKLANEAIKPAAGLAWNPAEDITLTVGEALTAPTLLNPNNIDAAEITIASSNTNVATINNGEVELVADATGTTTITATFAGNDDYKPATVSYKIKVNPAHAIYVSPSLKVEFGSVAQDATIEDKKITVTLTNVDAATLTLAGDGASAFTISPAAALTASGDITISASSATAGTFAATLTISDDAGEATSRVVNLSLTVVDPATVETAISTSTKWVAAVAADLVDGAEVLITGVKDNVTYAMGEQKSTNRAAYEATIDGEGVLTPGAGTMAFTLVAQGDGTYAIRTSNGQYLYAAKNDANHLKTQNEVDVNAKWTLTTTSAVAEGSSNRNIMRFNGGSSKLFSCYSSGQEDIKFYVPNVAKIGSTNYASLPAAVAAAQDGDVVELLMDVAAGPGVMITTAEHKQIIIDFGNHTYCANSPAVGSAGTQNQAFHFEKGCNITLQNGTITSSGNEIIMLIQNYGDLTLKDITLIGNNLPGTHRYVLSNNCGNVVIGAGTTITAKEGHVAFDVCVTNYYPEGTQVTVEGGATITGIVEYDVWGTIPADNKATLTIKGGNFNITWNVEPALAEDAKDNINVKGGTFNAEVPADYCADGYIPKDNGNGQYGVHYAGFYERGSLTPGNYATICLPRAGKISGASLFDIEYYENSTLYLLEVEGNAMVAGRPYIFLPSVEKIEVIYTDAVDATAGSFNGLVGSLSLVAEVIAPNDGNYILYNNAYYYVNSEAYVGANRAYIHMADVPTEPSAPQVGNAPRRRVAMAVNGEQVATGIDEVQSDNVQSTKVLINGELFILRGEKMYNANGQLVK